MNEELAELYMQRCFILADKANSLVQTNPNVGCVLVYNNRIIGEGYHERFGGAHAEINALQSVKTSDQKYIANSTMYVSLEPCNHQGKTGPCVDAISHNQIKDVVISCTDPNPKMQSKSIRILQERGIKVTSGILETAGKRLLRRFATNQLKSRPFVTIKYAESLDHFIGKEDERIKISNAQSDYLVHQLRAKSSAIMIGTDTAMVDNPKLDCRIEGEPSPLRIILDRQERIPKTHQVIDDDLASLIISTDPKYKLTSREKELMIIEEKNWNLNFIFRVLYDRGISSLLIEGGSKLLTSCIVSDLWDESYVIRSQQKLSDGVKAPSFTGKLERSFQLGSDQIFVVNHLEASALDW